MSLYTPGACLYIPRVRVFIYPGCGSLYTPGAGLYISRVRVFIFPQILICISLADDGTQVVTYLDGQFVARASIGLSTGVSQLYIGRSAVGAGLNGYINGVRLFTRALQPSEIYRLYMQSEISITALGALTSQMNPFNDGTQVAYFPLNGNMSDLMGNYNGVVTGSLSFSAAGNSNGYMSPLFGTGNYFHSTATVPYTSTSQKSMCSWVKLTSYSQLDPAGLISFGVSNGGQMFQLGPQGSGVNQWYFWGNGQDIGSVRTDTQWHHVGVTYDSTMVVIYLDGLVVGRGTPSLNTGLSSLFIGATTGYGPYYALAGYINSVRLFSRALQASEIQRVYMYGDQIANTLPLQVSLSPLNQLNPFGDGSQVAYFPLNGNTIDQMGNYNGLVTGSLTFSAAGYSSAVGGNYVSPSFSAGNFFTSTSNVAVTAGRSMCVWVKLRTLSQIDTGAIVSYGSPCNTCMFALCAKAGK